MDIVKISTDWARAETMSNAAFVLAGGLSLAVGFALWSFGRSDVTRAFPIPLLVAGLLLSGLGLGLLYGTRGLLSGMEAAVAQDAPGFVGAEIARAEPVLAQYDVALFRVFPAIVAAAALLLIVLRGPVWQASLIVTMLTVSTVMLIDATANARMMSHRAALVSVQAGR